MRIFSPEEHQYFIFTLYYINILHKIYKNIYLAKNIRK